ncbi:MAG: arginase [Flavobacteriaceae bacterium]|nr:arginase [Flavobacteriaceae bacterium]MCY4267937.1 arginase [Flavobacteriaceae bacterium]MCY4298645.1 arginase [Flavobacteriaceae bacterium]
MKNIVILKNRSDIGGANRGSDMGIDAIEVAAINADNDFFNRLPFIEIQTHNETVYNKVHNTFAKRIEFVTQQCLRVKKAVHKALKNNQFPLIISGDHSSAMGTIAGVKSAYPSKTLGVIWIDAHADLHTPWSSPSGNIHGMCLAGALGFENRQYSKNKVSSETINYWQQLKTLDSKTPMIIPENLIYFGVRSVESVEKAIIKQYNITCYSVHEVRYRSIAECLNKTLHQLESVDNIYISFDVDALDCDLISDGTGTPVSKGFDSQEIIRLINGFFKTQKVIALEISEVNPLLDTKGNSMAESTFEIMNQIFLGLD